MKKDHLSIYTDASFNCQQKVAAYAFYLILNGKVANYANSFSYKVKSAKDAEILALGHALTYVLSEAYKLTFVKSISIHLDSTMAIEDVRQQVPGIALQVNKLWQRLISKTGSKENKLEHVKAHSDKKGVTFESNSWCDANARSELRKRVEEINATRNLQKQMGSIAIDAKRLSI